MIEVFSIHIPKTAGTSFYAILQANYGEESCVEFKRRDIKSQLAAGESLRALLAPTVRVLHGHVKYREAADLVAADRPKVIVWLRDPVDRVLSNYFFFQQRIASGKVDPRQSRRQGESVLDYARLPDTQNRMVDFLAGCPLEDLFFIGRLESFATDLARLGEKLGWSEYPKVYANKSQVDKAALPPISSADREQIARWNQADMELYNYRG